MLGDLQVNKPHANAANPQDKEGHNEHKSRVGHLLHISFFRTPCIVHFRQNREIVEAEGSDENNYSVEMDFLLSFPVLSDLLNEVVTGLSVAATDAVLTMSG